MFNTMFCYLLLVVVCSMWLTVSADQVSTAATLKKIAEFDELIDETVNPCDDFQKYVCSRKKENFDVENSKDVNRRLTNRVAAGVQSGDQEAVKKFYDFYGKCKEASPLNDTIHHRLLEDLDSVLMDVSGNYQPFDPTLIAKLTAYLNSKLAISFFVSFYFDKPLSKTSRWFSKKENIFYVGEFGLLYDLFFYDPNSLPDYTDWFYATLQKHVAAAFPTKLASEVNKTASEFFELEIEMSKLLHYKPIDTLELEKQLHELTVGEAMTKYSGMDWRTLITEVSNYSDVDLLQGSKLEDYPLVITNPEIVKTLPKVIKMVSEETLREYIQLRVLLSFRKNVMTPKNNRAEVCKGLVSGPFSLVLQYFLITDMLPTPEERNEWKSNLNKLIDDIVASAENMLEGISWIKNDNKTFAGFTNKIKKLKKVSGFPDFLVDQSWLDEQYKDFILDDTDDLYSLYLKTLKFMQKKNIEGNLYYGTLSIIQSNAYYVTTENLYQINIAEVSDATYNQDYIPALNYGALGTFIGHEVLHAFDSKGRNYDGDGYVNPWMSANSKAKFDSMTQCVIDEYDKFNATDSTGFVRPVNGTFTLGENMSDIGGIRAAYTAFKKNPAHTQSFPKTKKLEKYTQEQLFFLAFARANCAAPFTDLLLLNDEHAPFEIRILGTLRNFVPFREAFNCPVNSVYAPEKHCEVYTPDLNSASSLIPSLILFVIMVLVN